VIINDQCGKTIVRGMMDAGINNVIYMELHSGPKMANGTCGKMIVAGTIDRGSTVLDRSWMNEVHMAYYFYLWPVTLPIRWWNLFSFHIV
jgi:hypothetical protein